MENKLKLLEDYENEAYQMYTDLLSNRSDVEEEFENPADEELDELLATYDDASSELYNLYWAIKNYREKFE